MRVAHAAYVVAESARDLAAWFRRRRREPSHRGVLLGLAPLAGAIALRIWGWPGLAVCVAVCAALGALGGQLSERRG